MSTSLIALGRVLREARSLLGRSPEQVGRATSLTGRTIRRLEAAETHRPHASTLEALAAFYALDSGVLHQLVAWSPLDQRAVIAQLALLDESAPDDFTVEQRAMRLARRGVAEKSAPPAEHADPEVADVVEQFLALDRGRRTRARMLLRDLRTAADAERARGFSA